MLATMAISRADSCAYHTTVTKDGRARVDYHGPLSDLEIWDGELIGDEFKKRTRRTDLMPDYS